MTPARDVDPTAIAIPAPLRPHDGRFGSGPSKVRDDAVAALADAAHGFMGTSHRQAGVRSVVGRIRAGIVDLLSLPDGYEVLLGNGGSTAFWDAASFGLIERRAQHCVFGEFGQKFADVTRRAPHLEDPVVLETPPGSHPVPEADATVDAYAYPQNETSTGVMMPVRRPAGARADQLVLVDATSGAGGLRVDAEEFDVYYFAPQKSFGSDGGLWLAACSPRAVERIERIATSGRWIPTSLDLHVALENSRLDQTYNTPALATLFLLANQIDWMLAHGGLEWCASRCDESAANIYGWAESRGYTMPFVAEPAMRSHVTATIDFTDTVDASLVAKVLRANGIVDTEPYRKLGRNQLRVGIFPAVEPDDVERLTRAIDFVVDALAG